MARRATIFKTAANDKNKIFISGGYEFCSKGSENNKLEDAAKLVTAYQKLHYNLLLLAQSDQAYLNAAKAQIPSTWLRPNAEPRTEFLDTPDGRLAFVVFPETAEQPNADTYAKLRDVAQQLRKSHKYSLIIGLSTWGDVREAEFIDASQGTFDLVLGSGEGPNYSGLYLQDNKTIWVRAYAKGKGMNIVTIPTLPKPDQKITWEPEVSAKTIVEPLKDSYESDKDIEAIFAH